MLEILKTIETRAKQTYAAANSLSVTKGNTQTYSTQSA